MSEIAERVACMEARIGNLEGWLEAHEKRQCATLEKIDKRLERIEQNLSSRPSWAVSALLTALSSVTIGLSVYFLTGR